MPTTTYIDINCDLAESEDPKQWHKDSLLMPYISSCNIACGGHVGTSDSIIACIESAKQQQLKIGAHPSYPDRKNFGRKPLQLSEKELRESLHQQLELMLACCHSQQVNLNHIKPHGALYNQAAVDEQTALLIAEIITSYSSDISFMGLANSKMSLAAQQYGLKFIAEGFMDRAYQNDATLAPRSQDGSVFESVEQSISQAEKLALNKPICTINNQYLTIEVDSICLHGDNPKALQIAKQLTDKLTQHQVKIG